MAHEIQVAMDRWLTQTGNSTPAALNKRAGADRRDKRRRRQLKERDRGPQFGTPLKALNLGRRAYGALRRRGVSTVEELVKMSSDEILACYGIGATTLREIQAALERWMPKEKRVAPAGRSTVEAAADASLRVVWMLPPQLDGDPTPLARIPVGPRLRGILDRHGIVTVGQLCGLSVKELAGIIRDASLRRKLRQKLVDCTLPGGDLCDEAMEARSDSGPSTPGATDSHAKSAKKVKKKTARTRSSPRGVTYSTPRKTRREQPPTIPKARRRDRPSTIRDVMADIGEWASSLGPQQWPTEGAAAPAQEDDAPSGDAAQPSGPWAAQFAAYVRCLGWNADPDPSGTPKAAQELAHPSVYGLVDRWLRQLEPGARIAVVIRYGLRCRPCPLEDVAKRLGISRLQAKQLVRDAVGVLGEMDRRAVNAHLDGLRLFLADWGGLASEDEIRDSLGEYVQVGDLDPVAACRVLAAACKGIRWVRNPPLLGDTSKPLNRIGAIRRHVRKIMPDLAKASPLKQVLLAFRASSGYANECGTPDHDFVMACLRTDPRVRISSSTIGWRQQ